MTKTPNTLPLLGAEMTNNPANDALVKQLVKLAEEYDYAPEGTPLSPTEAIIDFLHGDDVLALLTAPAEASIVWKWFDDAYFRADKTNSRDDWMTAALLAKQVRDNPPATLPQSAPVSRESVIEECAKVADAQVQHINENAKNLREFGVWNEQEARCRELAAVYVSETADSIRAMQLAAHPAEPEKGRSVTVPITQIQHWLEYWNGSSNERAMSDALDFLLSEFNALLPAAEPAGKGAQWIALCDDVPADGQQVCFRVSSGSEFPGKFLASTEANPFAKFIRDDGHGSYTYKVVTHWHPAAGGKRG